MGWWESQSKNQIFFILKILHDWWKYWRSVGKRFPNLYYWCKIPPQSLIFPYCALNQCNPPGELASIKGEINFPLDWLTVQKAKLTWQSELDDSLSSQQSYSVQGKVDKKVNCIRRQLTVHSCCDKAGQKPGGSGPTLVLKYTNFRHLLIQIINDLSFNID